MENYTWIYHQIKFMCPILHTNIELGEIAGDLFSVWQTRVGTLTSFKVLQIPQQQSDYAAFLKFIHERLRQTNIVSNYWLHNNSSQTIFCSVFTGHPYGGSWHNSLAHEPGQQNGDDWKQIFLRFYKSGPVTFVAPSFETVFLKILFFQYFLYLFTSFSRICIYWKIFSLDPKDIFQI